MKKLTILISILSLLIISACVHTGRAIQSKDLSAEDIRPNYAKAYDRCTHMDQRCNSNIQEECRGGYWHTKEFCQYGCENNGCNPQPQKITNTRVPGTRGTVY